MFRAETAATFLLLLVLSARWNHLLRALRFFRVPAVIVVIMEMTQRYVFLLLQTARDMLESRQTRLVGYLQSAERRRLAVASAGVLLEKSLDLTNEVHTAMQARGFRGNIYLLDDLHLPASGWLHLTLFLTVAISAILVGR